MSFFKSLSASLKLQGDQKCPYIAQNRYPASCIRSSQGMISARCDYQLILSSFVRDLSSRMPIVCGKPLSLTSTPVYPTNRLQRASLTRHNNLTRTAATMNHCIPFPVHHGQEKVMHANSPLGSAVASPVSSQSKSSRFQFEREVMNSSQKRVTPILSLDLKTPTWLQLPS